jgi:predicted O-methyltransferase YrrM
VNARLREMADHKKRPRDPWLTRQAIDILDTYLKGSDAGLETGSGRSTQWFAKRLGRLTSLEHNAEWHGIVTGQLKEAGVGNVEYHLLPKETGVADEAQPYVKHVAGLADGSLDFALVDGVYRDWCALHAMKKLKPGGVMVIDNVNWFLPSNSHSPNSRRHGEAAKSETWASVEAELMGWRRIWTSSGVTDTAFFFKPL